MLQAQATVPVTIITGASSGIGRALAVEASVENADLLLISRSEAPLRTLAAEIGAKGRRAHVLVLDLAEADAPERVAAFVADNGLHADVLVNNAGFGLLGTAASLSAAEQVRMVELNCRALTALTLRFLPEMLARGRGGVLNVGSVAGFLPGPGMAVYYATKAYVRSFSEALWEETRRSGVVVSCLAPGPVDTPFFDKAGVGQSRMFSTMRHMDAGTCARIGWNGFRRGKRMIVPGIQNRLATIISSLVPSGLLLPMVRKLQKARSAA